MFTMDFTSRGRAWIGKIGEKLESLCSDVDVRSQEQLGFVGNQLQIAGANLKQFCSEFIEEIFPASLSDAEEETSNLSSEQNREEQLFASELPNSVQEDNKDELSHSNSSSPELAEETAEGVHVDSSVQPQADRAMHMSVEGNLEKALSFTGENSTVVVSTDETLKTSLSCEGVKGVDGHAKASAALPAVSNGASVDHHVNEPATYSVAEKEFDGNCVLVDKGDLSSGSELRAAFISYKKNMRRLLKAKPGKRRNKDASKWEDVRVELEQSNAECKTKSSSNENLELSQEGFCESDWEII